MQALRSQSWQRAVPRSPERLHGGVRPQPRLDPLADRCSASFRCSWSWGPWRNLPWRPISSAGSSPEIKDKPHQRLWWPLPTTSKDQCRRPPIRNHPRSVPDTRRRSWPRGFDRRLQHRIRNGSTSRWSRLDRREDLSRDWTLQLRIKRIVSELWFQGERYLIHKQSTIWSKEQFWVCGALLLWKRTEVWNPGVHGEGTEDTFHSSWSCI